MFDLETVRNNGTKRTKSKKERSDDFYKEFLTLIGDYTNNGEDDLGLLEKAVEKLLQSIELSHSDPELYCSLAFVFYMLNRGEEASYYADYALSLAPESKNIKSFLKSFQLI